LSTRRGDIVKKKDDKTPSLFDAEECLTTDADVLDAIADLLRAVGDDEVEKALGNLPYGMLGLLSKKRGLRIFPQKMLEDFCESDGEQLLPTESGHLESWGIVANGMVLTLKGSEFFKRVPSPSLEEVLEPNPDPKYFVSKRRLEGMIRHKERHKAAGHGFGMKIVARQVREEVDDGEDSEGV
jgi:hypothetical protein